MTLILGIDAAWTEKGSSGIALLEYRDQVARIVAKASSYQGFLHDNFTVNHRLAGSMPVIPDLLAKAAQWGKVDLVAVDMPLASQLITGRRVSDNAISSAFGKYQAAVHSPSPERPGLVALKMYKDFKQAQYQLKVKDDFSKTLALLEVYPLAALVQLSGEKINYKTSKINKFCQYKDLPNRARVLLRTWGEILDRLRMEGIQIDPFLPPPEAIRSLAQLKPYEDILDAIICAWVGLCWLREDAISYGDQASAIWVPKPRY